MWCHEFYTVIKVDQTYTKVYYIVVVSVYVMQLYRVE